MSATVFLLTHEFFPKRGGIATFAEEMAGAAAGLGHDVEVWAQASACERPGRPFRVRRLDLPGTHDWGCQLRMGLEMLRHRRRLRRGTLYLAEPGPMLVKMFLQFAGAVRPARLVLTFHGSEILRFAHHPWRRRLAARLIARADRVSTLTGFTRDLLLRHFPEAEGKLVLTPGALRTDLGVPGARRRPEGARVVVLTVGRLHPRKGQRETLAALQALPASLRVRVEYRLAGSGGRGAYERELRALAARRPDLAVTFLGDVPDGDLGRVYADADLFALTSVSHGHSVEGFGLVYLEAAAHGLPVVAHAVGGVGEAVADGRTGILVPPDRPEQLTAALARLIEDPDGRRRLGAAGPAWARRTSWRESAAALLGPEPL